MPPKVAADAEVNPLSDAEMKYVVTVLKHVEALEVDWHAVAAEINMTRADNAGTKFQNVLKKLGVRLVKGKIMSLEDAAAATATKKGTTTRKRKAKEAEGAAEKKPKVEEDDEDDEAAEAVE